MRHMQRNMCMMNLKTSYHSAHKRSGPTNSNRSASTLLKAIRKYAKKCRICRLTLLLMIVLSALPMAEYRNLDVILWSNFLYDVDWIGFFSFETENNKLRTILRFVIVWMSYSAKWFNSLTFGAASVQRKFRSTFQWRTLFFLSSGETPFFNILCSHKLKSIISINARGKKSNFSFSKNIKVSAWNS